MVCGPSDLSLNRLSEVQNGGAMSTFRFRISTFKTCHDRAMCETITGRLLKLTNLVNLFKNPHYPRAFYLEWKVVPRKSKRALKSRTTGE